MLRFLAKRILAGIPVLIVVSIVIFFLSSIAPGDIVETLLTSSERNLRSEAASYNQRLNEYKRVAADRNLDVPLFYFAVDRSCVPDTLYRIVRKSEREAARQLMRSGATGVEVYATRNIVLQLIQEIELDTAVLNRQRIINELEFLLATSESEAYSNATNSVATLLAQVGAPYAQNINDLNRAAQAMFDHSNLTMIDMLPTLRWYGLNNRYHIWLSNLLGGDFGVSIVDGMPIRQKISDAIAWTLRINLAAIFLAFLIAIPLGLYIARRQGSRSDRFISAILFGFFAIPSFWLATMFIVFLTTPEYGRMFDLFPGSGVPLYTRDGYGLGTLISHLFLPVLSLLLGALAYLTRQMRQGVIEESTKDYVRMARAKGLSERQVYRKHILRNALFPIITIVGAAIPATVSGSVVIEVIFGIPGMGRLLYQSILSLDWNVVFLMVLLASALTVIGYALSDILYRWLDPRVKGKTSLTW